MPSLAGVLVHEEHALGLRRGRYYSISQARYSTLPIQHPSLSLQYPYLETTVPLSYRTP